MNMIVYVILCMLWVVLCEERRGLRIINGRDATPGEFPYAVRIELHAKNTTEEIVLIGGRCSGAAIAKTWVLTNANCPDHTAPYIYKDNTLYATKTMVRYGSPHLNPSKLHDVVAVLKVTTPSRFSEYPIKEDDIALLHTDPILLDSFARLSAVDYASLHGQGVTVIGFGKMQVKPSENVFLTSSALNRPLQVLDKFVLTSCRNSGLPELKRQIFKLCALPACGRENESVLHGDSGAPVIHATGVVGIVSRASDQLLQRMLLKFLVVPNIVILTPLSPYIDWIARQINEGGG